MTKEILPHTPLPWRVAMNGSIITASEPGSLQPSKQVGRVWDRYKSERENLANAEFIVRACNAHYDLLAALEEVMAWCGSIADESSRLPLDYIVQALSAIQKAKGEA